jgi:hypothetical protein
MLSVRVPKLVASFCDEAHQLPMNPNISCAAEAMELL